MNNDDWVDELGYWFTVAGCMLAVWLHAADKVIS